MWPIVLTLGALGTAALVAMMVSRRNAADVEPTVREFAAFREAISDQVAGVHAEVAHARDAHSPHVGEPGHQG